VVEASVAALVVALISFCWLATVELAAEGAADGDDGPVDASNNRRR
jgi:hypothetical protein